MEDIRFTCVNTDEKAIVEEVSVSADIIYEISKPGTWTCTGIKPAEFSISSQRLMEHGAKMEQEAKEFYSNGKVLCSDQEVKDFCEADHAALVTIRTEEEDEKVRDGTDTSHLSWNV